VDQLLSRLFTISASFDRETNKIESSIVRYASSPSRMQGQFSAGDFRRTNSTDPTKIFGTVYLLLSETMPPENPGSQFSYFTVSDQIYYTPFCEDFGPYNLGMLYEFCQDLDRRLQASRDKFLVFVSNPHAQTLTNNVFLLGGYMTMRLEMPPSAIERAFEPWRDSLATYRDVSPGEQNFHLCLRDCWAGLSRARSQGLVDFGEDGFDAAEYAELDDPLNADLHEVVPSKLCHSDHYNPNNTLHSIIQGCIYCVYIVVLYIHLHQVVPSKLLAMKGPCALPGGRRYLDRPGGGGRDFSPAHYADILAQFGARAVVRLNMPAYAAAEFEVAERRETETRGSVRGREGGRGRGRE
jgi:hypothetical protein